MDPKIKYFNYNGYHYYLEPRTCSKPTCKCHNGTPHGPYWWSKSLTHGTRKYIGRNLPADIEHGYILNTRIIEIAEKRLIFINNELTNLHKERSNLLAITTGSQLTPTQSEYQKGLTIWLPSCVTYLPG